MSVHRSLREARGGSSNRSVYTRWERLQILQANGIWSEDDASVFGLPKVKTKKIRKKAAKKKVKAE